MAEAKSRRHAAPAMILGVVFALACKPTTVPDEETGIEMREGQPVAQPRPTPLYSPKFVIRAMAADGENLYVTGLRFDEPRPPAQGAEPSAESGASTDDVAVPGEVLPTGMVVKVPLLGVPEVLAEGAFLPMTSLVLLEDRLYWHERHDSPDGPGLRSLSADGGDLDRISTMAGHSWVIGQDYVYFTRPDDEIDEGGFYMLERGTTKPKLVVRRKGVVRTLLADAAVERVFWTTRARSNGTWGVYQWDGGKSGNEILSSDETFASIMIDGEDFMWVTWAEDEGEPLHSLYRRPISGGEIEILARKRGLPGFMEILSDESHVYLTTVRGGELRRLPRLGGEIQVLTGSGDREAVSNRFNMFWVEDERVYWMGK